MSEIKDKTIDVGMLKNRQRILHAVQQWKPVLDNSPDMVAILDNNRQVILLNQTACVRLGVAQDQAAGKDYCTLLHQGILTARTAGWSNPESGSPARSQSTYLASLSEFRSHHSWVTQEKSSQQCMWRGRFVKRFEKGHKKTEELFFVMTVATASAPSASYRCRQQN